MKALSPRKERSQFLRSTKEVYTLPLVLKNELGLLLQLAPLQGIIWHTFYLVFWGSNCTTTGKMVKPPGKNILTLDDKEGT